MVMSSFGGLLQWSRSLGSCGNWTANSAPTRMARFNGAAALGAAETAHYSRSSFRICALQWSRSLGSCGNVYLQDRISRWKQASMEPQPWELRKHVHKAYIATTGKWASMEPQPWE